MNQRFRSLLLLMAALVIGAGQPAAGSNPPQPPGENLARGCLVTFSPPPAYAYCTDPDDSRQLTDGEYTTGYFWVQRGTVGWSGVSPVQITLDLGRVQPIAGVSYNTAAGTAGVAWPAAIYVATSDDGQTWRYAGDLVILAAEHGLPPADGYHVHRYVTTALLTRGRYVRLAVVPRGGYTFCDEIEVFRGPDSLLTQEPAGEIVNDMAALAQREATRTSIFWRLRSDLAEARDALQSAPLPLARKQQLRICLDAAEQEIPRLAAPNPDLFETIFPINDLHARILAVHGPILRARGLPRFLVWRKPRYAFLRPHEVPRSIPGKLSLSLHMMRNEHRAESLLLTNASEQPVRALLRVRGLPGAPRPSWLRVCAVPWTDTSHRVPIAAALPDAVYADGGFQIPVPAGLTCKVWLAVHSAPLRPGRYQGTLSVEGVGEPVRIPFQVRVSPVTMSRPRLSLGMWDYTDGTGAYGLTTFNRDAAIALMRSHFVDTPWAKASVLPWPPAEAFDDQHQLKGPLPFPPAFDQWVARWPHARHYFVFAAVGAQFAGATIGTPEFHARVGAWARALVHHMRTLKLQPQQLGLLLVDEPYQEEQDAIVAAWARAIKSAAPEITLFQDPIWPRPDQTRIQEAITLCDIVCPNLPIFYQGGPDVARYFERRRAVGQKLWFYQCSGPAKLFDPYRYHRLQAWHAFRHGAVGIGFWAFGDTGGARTSWNEYAAAGTPFTPAFLGTHSATDGVHWEAVREGIEDYEYLSMLRDAAARVADPGLKARATALLQEAVQSLTRNYSANYDWKQESDCTQADIFRLRILALLEKMQ